MRILEGPSRERMLERKPTTDSHLSIVSVCLLNEKQKEGTFSRLFNWKVGDMMITKRPTGFEEEPLAPGGNDIRRKTHPP